MAFPSFDWDVLALKLGAIFVIRLGPGNKLSRAADEVTQRRLVGADHSGEFHLRLRVLQLTFGLAATQRLRRGSKMATRRSLHARASQKRLWVPTLVPNLSSLTVTQHELRW
jgi:hypothetical protein